MYFGVSIFKFPPIENSNKSRCELLMSLHKCRISHTPPREAAAEMFLLTAQHTYYHKTFA